MRSLRPLGLTLALAALAAGCFESHGLGERREAGPRPSDAGADSAPVRDAAPRPDTAPPPPDPRRCIATASTMYGGEPPVPPDLWFAVVNVHGAEHGCPSRLTFVLMDEEVVVPRALPTPRLELEASFEENVLAEGFDRTADGVARVVGPGGEVTETPAVLRVETDRLEFGPGGDLMGTARVRFDAPAWSLAGAAEAPYCFASICL